MKRQDLVREIEALLGSKAIPDASLNGLQVEGREDVSVLATAVDASLVTIEQAKVAGAHALLVHHGIFWKQVLPITGRWHRLVKTLLDADMSLIAMHLPLDIHPEHGNNAILAKRLGLVDTEFTGNYHGVKISMAGRIPQPMSLGKLRESLRTIVAGSVTCLEGGPETVSKVVVCSGGGGSLFEDAVSWGADAFITGEGGHILYHAALENRVSVLFGGHYATETLGVRSVGDWAARQFGLKHVFIDVPTGM